MIQLNIWVFDVNDVTAGTKWLILIIQTFTPWIGGGATCLSDQLAEGGGL